MSNTILHMVVLLFVSHTMPQEVRLEDFSQLPSCPGKVLSSNYTYKRLEGLSRVKCASLCVEDGCKSFQHDRVNLSCRLSDESDTGDCSKMVDGPRMRHFEKISKPRCLHGGYLADEKCACAGGYVGNACERLMTDCTDGVTSGQGYVDGVYDIQPANSATSFPVYCEMKFSGRTLMMLRSGQSVDFYRNWNDYRNGFGDVISDHWLGLENIHQLTKGGYFELIVSLQLRNGSYYKQHYSNYKIENESEEYKMTFSKTKPDNSYPLGDCLTPLNGSSFSTYDQDNDAMPNGSCAVDYNSGWWFHACADCNPTGRLLKPGDSLRTNVSHEVYWTNDLGNLVPKKVKIYLVKP